jgi:hypothetical protein
MEDSASEINRMPSSNRITSTTTHTHTLPHTHTCVCVCRDHDHAGAHCAALPPLQPRRRRHLGRCDLIIPSLSQPSLHVMSSLPLSLSLISSLIAHGLTGLGQRVRKGWAAPRRRSPHRSTSTAARAWPNGSHRTAWPSSQVRASPSPFSLSLSLAICLSLSLSLSLSSKLSPLGVSSRVPVGAAGHAQVMMTNDIPYRFRQVSPARRTRAATDDAPPPLMMHP